MKEYTEQQIYQFIEEKHLHSILPIAGMTEEIKEFIRQKTERAFYNIERVKLNENCGECDKSYADPYIISEWFGSPWDIEGTIYHFCDAECRENFECCSDTFYCERCDRNIATSRGHLSHVRTIDECEQICLQCYQEEILENGVDVELIQEGKLPGMFFNHGNAEVTDAGWETHKYNFFVHFGQREELMNELLELSEKYKLIIAYEHLSIMGDEGWISIYKKEREE